MQDGEILYCYQDIARHNALDKAVGRALMDGVDLRRCVLFSSGRIPADMMERPSAQACRCWPAMRFPPTAPWRWRGLIVWF